MPGIWIPALPGLAAVLLVTGWRLISLHHARALRGGHGMVSVAIRCATGNTPMPQALPIRMGVGLAVLLVGVLPDLRRRCTLCQSDGPGAIRRGWAAPPPVAMCPG